MRKYLYLSAVCVCMALCFVGCSKDDDEPGGKGAMYEVTIEQSGDFRSFIKSVVVVANGTQLKDGATGESLASPVIRKQSLIPLSILSCHLLSLPHNKSITYETKELNFRCL